MPWFSFPPCGELNNGFLSCMDKHGYMEKGELLFLSQELHVYPKINYLINDNGIFSHKTQNLKPPL